MYDLRPHFPELPAEGQIEEGGANAVDNCEPTSFAFCLLALGLGDPLEPQAIMDGAYGQGHVGGADPDVILAYIRTRTDVYRPLPAIAIEEVDGLGFVQKADAYGQQGWPVIGAFWCDSQARILPVGDPAIVASHASIPIAFDGQTWTVWNVWTGYEQLIPNDTMVHAFTPGPWMVVFHQSVFPDPGGGSMSITRTPDDALHVHEVDEARTSLTHRFSNPAHPDASLDLESDPPAQEETIPGPPGCLIDPASVSVAIKGDSFNITVRTTDPAGAAPAGCGRVQLLTKNWTTGEVGRPWTVLKDLVVPLAAMVAPVDIAAITAAATAAAVTQVKAQYGKALDELARAADDLANAGH